MFLWNSLTFSMIQRMLAIWSLVPLPFLNPAWTSGSSRFMYCWSLMWKILSITSLACVQFSRSVVSDSLQPHELQHTWFPCPSPTPRIYPNSCPLSQWCHPAISSSVVPFSSCHQSFPAPWSFQMSQPFASGGQSIGVSASTSVLLGLISLRMDWLDLIAVQGTVKSLLQHHSSEASILIHSAFFIVQLSHPYVTTGKTTALTRRIFVDKVMSLLFHMLSRLVITFLPRSKRLLISWLQTPSAVILEPRKIKLATVSTVSPSICHEVMGLQGDPTSPFWRRSALGFLWREWC